MTKNNTLRVKHQYNLGDLIASLPGFQYYYQQTGIRTLLYQQLGLPAYYYQGADHPIKNTEGQQVTMNRKMYDMVKPLILAQDYIYDMLIWEGNEVDFDFRVTRDSREMPLPYGDINSWPFLMFPQLTCDLSIPWIDTGYRSSSAILQHAGKIIVNRTFRYTNPHISYYFLKEHQENILFMGVEEEYEYFKSEFKLDIARVLVRDFLEAAIIIRSCKMFIGNQSFMYHIAEAMKVPRILEICATYPNTWPHGANGYPFTHQSGLEFYFNKLNK